VHYPREKSLLADFLSSVEAKIQTVVKLKTNPAQQLVDFLNQIQNKPLALMPFRIEWR